MGLTQKLGTIPLAIQTDSSNNVGIGGAAEAGWILKSTGNTKISSGSGTTVLQVNDTSTGGKAWSLISAGAGNAHSVPAGTFYLRNSSDGITSLQIASTGAATFNIPRTSGTNVDIMTLSDNVTGIQTSGFGVRILATSNNGQAKSAIAFEADGGTNNDTAIAFYTQFSAASLDRRMTINRNGNVGIGTSSPSRLLSLYATTPVLQFINPTTGITSNDGTQFYQNAENFFLELQDGGYYSISTGGSERMRITSGGNVLIGTTTNSGARIDARLASSGYPVISAINTNASNSRCYYGQKAYSSTDDYYMIFDNALDNKFLFYGNGGLGNVQANNVNLSDERTKKDIIPIESYWDKFKAIEIVKFKYLDQTHDDYNIGVIAQQVEAVAPEFVDSDGWGKDTPAESVEPLKSIYTADLYHATIKVLQEAMAKIEELEAKVTALENK